MALKKGKVIGEFVCDRIEVIGFSPYNHGEYICKDQTYIDQSCVPFEKMFDYLGEECGYGWHISDLVIYDKPKELSEFKTFCKYRNDDGSCQYTKIECDCVKFDFNPDYSVNFAECMDYMSRPPQSWCYVDNTSEK